MAELLSNETRAGTSGGAAARRCGARGVVDWQVDGGVGQPIAGGTRARQAMVAEGDQDGINISERRCWLSELMVMTVKYRRKKYRNRDKTVSGVI